MQVVIGASSSTKGLVKRTPREEMSLRVRILNGRHLQDVFDKVVAELGDRAHEIGPIDLTRNTLKTYAQQRGKAYLTPPLVDELTEEVARLIGDQSARTTVELYAAGGGRPMPTRLVAVSQEVLHYRLACNFVGTMLGWSPRSQRPYLEVVTPDDLEVDYYSHDPLTPTIIRHSRRRIIDGEELDVVEVYDLQDLDRPSYRIMVGDEDRTLDALGATFEGDDYWWRYSDGRPFHRIVISGDPREPYRGLELVEGTLRMAAGYSDFWASMRDAGYPRTHAIGLHLRGMTTNAATGQAGHAAGAETVYSWAHDDPDRPGTLVQHGPGYDPAAVGQALRAYETDLLSAFGFPVDLSKSGGEPTKREEDALREWIGSTFAECRGHDALVLRRLVAVHNRATERMGAAVGLPELALGCLYRHEVDEALGLTEEDTDGREP